MKNVINYYYQMNLENIHLVNGVYHFSYLHQNYLFFPHYSNPSFLQALYRFSIQNLGSNSYYHEIVLTKDKLPFLFLDQKYYVLLRVHNLIFDPISFYDIKFLRAPLDSVSSFLVRFPWVNFWMEKCDYFENLLLHLEKKFSFFLPAFYWYLGLSENAIQYVNSVISKGGFRERENLMVSHRRLDKNMSVVDFYNPLMIVVDHPARDVAEYLKSVFYYGDYSFSDISEYLENLPLTDFGFSFLFGRLLYPSFFFDLVDRFLQEEVGMDELVRLLDRIEEFRLFLKEVYFIIRKKSPIEEVRWIVR